MIYQVKYREADKLWYVRKGKSNKKIKAVGEGYSRKDSAVIGAKRRVDRETKSPTLIEIFNQAGYFDRAFTW